MRIKQLNKENLRLKRYVGFRRNNMHSKLQLVQPQFEIGTLFIGGINCHHCTTPFMIKAQRHSKQNEIAPLFANKNISISTQKDLEQNPGTWILQMEDRKNKTTVQKAMNQIECNPHPRYQYNLTQTENWPFILQFQLQQCTFMTLHLLQLD